MANHLNNGTTFEEWLSGFKRELETIPLECEVTPERVVKRETHEKEAKRERAALMLETRAEKVTTNEPLLLGKVSSEVIALRTAILLRGEQSCLDLEEISNGLDRQLNVLEERHAREKECCQRCILCLEPLAELVNMPNERTFLVVYNPCHHVSCNSCFDMLAKNNNVLSCPTCRAIIKSVTPFKL